MPAESAAAASASASAEAEVEAEAAVAWAWGAAWKTGGSAAAAAAARRTQEFTPAVTPLVYLLYRQGLAKVPLLSCAATLLFLFLHYSLMYHNTYSSFNQLTRFIISCCVQYHRDSNNRVNASTDQPPLDLGSMQKSRRAEMPLSTVQKSGLDRPRRRWARAANRGQRRVGFIVSVAACVTREVGVLALQIAAWKPPYENGVAFLNRNPLKKKQAHVFS